MKILRNLEISQIDGRVNIEEVYGTASINYANIKDIADLEPDEEHIIQLIKYLDKNLRLDITKGLAQQQINGNYLTESIKKIVATDESGRRPYEACS